MPSVIRGNNSFDSGSVGKQTEWSTYRTDLLGVPQQSKFPNSVAWPQEPFGQ